MTEEKIQEEKRGFFLTFMTKTFDPWLASKSGSNLLIIIVLLLVAVPIIGVGLAATGTVSPRDWFQVVRNIPGLSSPTLPAHAVFNCPDGKSINAVFGATSVELTLSDGRRLTLPQAVGVRYANPDGSFMFWSVGNTAFIEEEEVRTYDNCVTSA